MSCNHPMLQIQYVDNAKGKMEVEICDNPECAAILKTVCLHQKKEEREEFLFCTLCGKEQEKVDVDRTTLTFEKFGESFKLIENTEYYKPLNKLTAVIAFQSGITANLEMRIQELVAKLPTDETAKPQLQQLATQLDLFFGNIDIQHSLAFLTVVGEKTHLDTEIKWLTEKLKEVYMETQRLANIIMMELYK